jgi:hypothetical protein
MTEDQPPTSDVDFKMDFNQLKQKITKTAEFAESYFKEKEDRRNAGEFGNNSPGKQAFNSPKKLPTKKPTPVKPAAKFQSTEKHLSSQKSDKAEKPVEIPSV